MRTVTYDQVKDWHPAMIQAYFAEQQARLMERMLREMERQGRLVNNYLEDARDRATVAELAVTLMANRDLVLLEFEGCSSVPTEPPAAAPDQPGDSGLPGCPAEGDPPHRLPGCRARRQGVPGLAG